jgi:hypothetical protein
LKREKKILRGRSSRKMEGKALNRGQKNISVLAEKRLDSRLRPVLPAGGPVVPVV